MKKIIVITLLTSGLLSPLGASSPESARKFSVPVPVPAGLLTPEALSAIQKGCRMISSGKSAETVKIFKKALQGIQSPLLKGDIRFAAGKTSPEDSESTPRGERDGDAELRFSCTPEKKGAGASCFLYFLLRQSQSWLGPYLKDPNWMREDLPGKIRGVSAPGEYLPPIQPATLVASSRPEELSAMVSRRDGGGRILVFVNLIHEYCRQFLKKGAQKVFTESWLKNVDEKALLWLVCMRRMAHGMGPLAVRKGNSFEVVAVDVALGKSHFPLEEIKADVMSLLSGLRLAEKSKDFPVPASHLIATYSIYLLARSFPASDPSTKPFRAILLKLVNEGGLRFDLGVQKLIPDALRMRKSLKSMLQKVIRIQDSGSEEDAVSFLKALMKKAEKADLPAGLIMKSPPLPELVVEIDSGESSE